MSPVVRFKYGDFLDVDLQPCNTITDTLAPVECVNWLLSAWSSTLDQNDVPSPYGVAIKTVYGTY